MVTGAAGRIGQAICAALAERWDLVPVDIEPSKGVARMDVTDGAACRDAFAGADAVVHLAADPDPEASWDSLLPANIQAPYEVGTAAVACGVRRLVLASSLHAVGGYPQRRQRRATDQPRPVNLYGATKAWVEALGAALAATSSTTVVALRIGYFAETRPDDDEAWPGQRSAWLSTRDAAELVRAAVEATDVDGAVVVKGISANRYQFADLGEARALGFSPQDDAWTP